MFDNEYYDGNGDFNWEQWDQDFEKQWEEFKESEEKRIHNRIRRSASKVIDGFNSKVDNWRAIGAEQRANNEFILNYKKRYNR